VKGDWYGSRPNKPINFTDPTGLWVDYGNGGRKEVDDTTGDVLCDISSDGTDNLAGGPKDPVIEEQKKIDRLLDLLLRSSKGKASSLTHEIKTDIFSGELNKHFGYLDPDTAAYLRKLPEKQRKEMIKQMLDSQTIVTGIDTTLASSVALSMGMKIDPAGGEAFSVGGFIFVFDTVFDPDTMGHEAIHGIQSIAAGGSLQFLRNYNQACEKAGTYKINEVEYFDPIKGYYGNEYEIGAYTFGPKNRLAKTHLPQDGFFANAWRK